MAKEAKNDSSAAVEIPALGDTSAPEENTQHNPALVLGRVVSMLMDSPLHKHLFITDLEWLLKPALLARSYRLYENDGVPVALTTWAGLSEEVEKRYLSGVRRLQPGDWASGDRLWLIDIIAPYGGQGEVLKDMAKIFVDKGMKVAANRDGKDAILELDNLPDDVLNPPTKAEAK